MVAAARVTNAAVAEAFAYDVSSRWLKKAMISKVQVR